MFWKQYINIYTYIIIIIVVVIDAKFIYLMFSNRSES